MTFVLVSDIHANFPALEAFFDYLEKNGLSSLPRFYLGDYVNLGPFPQETVSRLSADSGSLFLSGNHDRYVTTETLLRYNPYFATEEGMNHVRWTRENLSKESLSWLRDLKSTYHFSCSGWNIVMNHGNPSTDEKPFDASQIREGEKTIYICGHSHIPRNEKVKDSWIINPGSLGKPLDGDNRASFGIARIGIGFVEFEVVRISYDIEKTVQALEDRSVPWRAGIIQSTRTAEYSHD